MGHGPTPARSALLCYDYALRSEASGCSCAHFPPGLTSRGRVPSRVISQSQAYAFTYQLQIVNSCDKIKTQRKPFTSIPVTIRQNLDSLEIADHILIENAMTRKFSITVFILLRKRMLFASLFWHVCLEMYLLQSLVSAISQYTDCWMDVYF